MIVKIFWLNLSKLKTWTCSCNCMLLCWGTGQSENCISLTNSDHFSTMDSYSAFRKMLKRNEGTCFREVRADYYSCLVFTTWCSLRISYELETVFVPLIRHWLPCMPPHTHTNPIPSGLWHGKSHTWHTGNSMHIDTPTHTETHTVQRD